MHFNPLCSDFPFYSHLVNSSFKLISVSGSVCRSVPSLCAWSTACSSVTVQETRWERNATCAASSLVTTCPCVLYYWGMCLHFVSQYIYTVSICTEVTVVHRCFPLDNLTPVSRTSHLDCCLKTRLFTEIFLWRKVLSSLKEKWNWYAAD